MSGPNFVCDSFRGHPRSLHPDNIVSFGPYNFVILLGSAVQETESFIIQEILLSSQLIDMARRQQSQTERKIGGNLQYQETKIKYSGFILWVSELIICREAVSRHQKTANPSQKPTFTSNTAVLQAVLIQKQSYPESAGTSFPFSKQHPRGQKSMCLLCFSYHVVVLT